MVMKPVAQSVVSEKRRNQVNGLAVFIFMGLLLLSGAVTVLMVLGGAPIG
jgi:hypothetical protein